MILLIFTLLSLFIIFYFHTFSLPPFFLPSFFPFLSFFFLSLCILAMISSFILMFISCTLFWEDLVIFSYQCRRHKRRGFGTRLGRAPRVGNSKAIQYSCLENSMRRWFWRTLVRGAHKESDTTEHTGTHTHKNLHTLKTFNHGYSLHSEHDCLLLSILWLLNKL